MAHGAGPSTPSSATAGAAVTIYYLATPLFALADFALGLPVRVAGLESPGHRVVYYLVLMACGLLCRVRPATVPWVGMFESAGNVTLLMISILLPVWTLPEAFAAGEALVGPFDGTSLTNVLLSGTALLVSFYRHQAHALGWRR